MGAHSVEVNNILFEPTMKTAADLYTRPLETCHPVTRCGDHQRDVVIQTANPSGRRHVWNGVPSESPTDIVEEAGRAWKGAYQGRTRIKIIQYEQDSNQKVLYWSFACHFAVSLHDYQKIGGRSSQCSEIRQEMCPLSIYKTRLAPT